MENERIEESSMDQRIAQRLKLLRAERGWSLDELAATSGVSRATLSRLENAAVSATASVLGKLCVAYGLTMSRLMQLVEDSFVPLLSPGAQPVWVDPSNGFRRLSVSPPAQGLAGEVLECSLEPATNIAYEGSPRQGMEHHLWLLEGQLDVSVDGVAYAMAPGDCLRYQLIDTSSFTTPAHVGARYLLFIV